MTKSIVADIPDTVLNCTVKDSDRYVYSNYYVPVLLTFQDGTPILPFYTKQAVIELMRYGSMDNVSSILNEIGPELWTKNELNSASENLINQDYNAAVAERPAMRPTVLALKEQQKEFVAGLLQSDIGYVFLDRTRITPVGFALGEHVYSLALAPGEEVVLEQKTFSKRQLTYEDQTDQEKQFDIELTSTLSTEIQEGLDRQKSLSDSWGLNLSHTGQYSTPQNLPWGSINASHTIGYSKNVTEANQETARRSAKDSKVASSKVSSRYRTQHKTTFKIVNEMGTEISSKRTVRNPNRTTSITLHYFKILQRLEMQQERYGARLCWAPCIKDPAIAFFEKIRKGKKNIIDTALAKLPEQPREPIRQITEEETPDRTETKWFISPVTEADKWGFSGDMSADYTVDISYDDGFEWDYDTSHLIIDIDSRRPDSTIGRRIVGTPIAADDGGNKLSVTVHIGAPPWFGGPGIKFQVKATFSKKVTVTQQSIKDTKYADDLITYRTLLKEWIDNRNTALAEANKEADKFETDLFIKLDPASEIISQVIERNFPPSVRDECWEIDLWQRIFDWERASFVTYPSWWSYGESRKPELDPADFINASWAKLYLPIRAGAEVSALRWIFGKVVNGQLSTEIEAKFSELLADLRNFRDSKLGTPDEVEDLTTNCQELKETVYCLAKWNELMPTDGTHIEVLQGTTTAADSITNQEIKDASDLRAAILKDEDSSTKLKDKANTKMTEPASVNVNIVAGASDEKA